MEERKVLRKTPTGTIDIVWDGRFTLIQMNCSCLDALPTCKGMCCRWKSGYTVRLEDDETDYRSIEYQGQRILAPDAQRQWCTYFDPMVSICTIHDRRPKMCRQWHCSPEGEKNDAQIQVRDAGWMLSPLRNFERNL